MTGWRRLITATVRLAHHEGAQLRRRLVDGRLLFEASGETSGRSAERVRGIVTGAWALSAEICEACGGPGDPVTLGSGGRGTRCGECREPGDRVLPRPAWRRKRETGHEAPDVLEDLVGSHDLADLMEARHTPATHAGWPVKRGQSDPDMRIVCPIGGAGWNHLLRGGLAVLLPLECPGVAPPWRASCIKERLGRLKFHHRHHRPFYAGVGAILSNVSATTCIYCGRPGRMRRPGWMHPACDQCWALEQRNPELVNPNREPIEDLVRAPAPRPVVGSTARDASTRLRASPRFLPAPPHAPCGPDCTAGAGRRPRTCAAA